METCGQIHIAARCLTRMQHQGKSDRHYIRVGNARKVSSRCLDERVGLFATVEILSFRFNRNLGVVERISYL